MTDHQIIITWQDSRGYVEIDGVDISGLVRALNYRIEVGQLPVIELELIALAVTLNSDSTHAQALAQCFDGDELHDRKTIVRKLDRDKLHEAVSVLKEHKRGD